MIMYAVILLTVLVDLIVAVGVGVFIANILTIERMSLLQSKSVKTISDADDTILLNSNEKRWLSEANDRVLLFQLSGPMLFGVAKAITREHNAIKDCDAVVFDLAEVPHLGVTASLTIENAIKEAIEKRRHVFLVGSRAQTLKRLKNLGVLELLPQNHLFEDREDALKYAASVVSPEFTSAAQEAPIDYGTSPRMG